MTKLKQLRIDSGKSMADVAKALNPIFNIR